MKFNFLIAFIFISAINIFAQEEKEIFPLGFIERIHSDHLDEDRVLNVYVPQGYHPDSIQTYPVIYVLDGSANEDYLHIVGIAQFMNMYELLPPSIVVGIANVDRYRDFTYPSSDKRDLEDLPTSGGSEKFMDFLEKEAMPHIRNQYKITENATIIGQSMGGLIATEILFKRPHLFNDYLIVSPSLWWDKEKMIRDADQYLENHSQESKRIFVSLGTEHPVMHDVADRLVEALKKIDAYTVFYAPLPNEDHATILHRAVYRGFELLYEKPAEEKE